MRHLLYTNRQVYFISKASFNYASIAAQCGFMCIKFMKAKCYFIKALRLLSTVLPFLVSVNYKDNITCKETIVFCLYTFAAGTRLLELVNIFYKKDKEALIHYI